MSTNARNEDVNLSVYRRFEMSEQLSVRGFISALRAMEGAPVSVAVGCGAPEPTAFLVGRLGTVREQGPPSDDGVWWIPVGDRALSTSYPGDESGFNLYESDVLAVTRPDPDTLHVQRQDGELEVIRHAHKDA